MSLVAYASSSGDESDSEENEPSPPNKVPVLNGHISDEEEIPIITEPTSFKSSLNLPVPKSAVDTDTIQALFGKLPEPKAKLDLIEEEDDEFLRKKATPLETPKPKAQPPTKNLVRITIPSLKDFDDVEKKKEKTTDVPLKHSGISSLMSILPTPKSEQNFIKPKPSEKETPCKESSKPMAFVPDAVKNRRLAQNTENVERPLSSKKPGPKSKPHTVSLVRVSDSDGSDNEGGDFFSLTNDDQLPEVSKDEIAAMVSRKAAEMAKSSSKFLAITRNDVPQLDEEPEEDKSTSNTPQTLDNEAIQALIGSQAKRRKMDDIQIIDIADDQVQPNKDEWLRTALASATTYQPTGVLTDEEPAAGTRRKHQITYLAHKAKANEAELQAMWSANRQNRRQTQNKYGF